MDETESLNMSKWYNIHVLIATCYAIEDAVLIGTLFYYDFTSHYILFYKVL
jgi:hypothetical protein